MMIKHTAALLTGRIIHGFGISLIVSNTTPYAINLTPPKYKYITGVLVLIMSRIGPIILYLFGLRVT